jgi:hypothetical protein
VGDYDGSWNVIDSSTFNSVPHGISTKLTLQVPWSTTAIGGTLNTDLSGQFFRACQGIFYVDSQGQSVSPSPTADTFFGFGEPSVQGQAWASSSPGQNLGGNGSPIPIDPSLIWSVSSTQLTYTSGTFHQDQMAAITIGDTGDTPAIFSFGFGLPDSTNQIETYVWNQPQGLAGGSTFSITFRTAWGRN